MLGYALALTLLTKSPPPALEADGGAVYLLSHETPNFEIGSVFRAGQYNGSVLSGCVFENKAEQ